MKKKLKVICAVMGIGAVGKSAIISRKALDNVEEVHVGILEEEFVVTIEYDGNKEMELQLTDTYGQEEYSSLRDSFYRENEAFIMVYSIDNEESFKEMDQFLTQLATCKEKSLDEIPVVLCGNKCEEGVDRKVDPTEASELAAKYKIPSIEVSAINNINIDELFIELCREISKKIGEGLEEEEEEGEIITPICCDFNCTLL